MGKYTLVLIALMYFGLFTKVHSQFFSPADEYYNQNIAVNPLSDEEDEEKDEEDNEGQKPGGGSSEDSGGNVISGDGEEDEDKNEGQKPGGDDGTEVDVPAVLPIGDAIVPIMTAGLAYFSFILYRRKAKKSEN